MTKDTFSRIKPSVNLVTPPPINVEGMEAYTDETSIAYVSFAVTALDLTGWQILFRSSPIVSKGVMTIKKSSLKFTKSVAGVISMATIDDGGTYFSVFGAPEIGSKVFSSIILVNTSTGQSFNAGTYSAIFQEA